METVIDIPAEHEANVFGQFDVYAKKIERALHVTLIARGESVKIMGDALKVEKAKKVLDQLVELSKRGNTIQEQNVDYTLALVMEDSEENVLEIDKDIICHTLQGKPIKPKTLGQKKYVDAIRKQMIVFGLGPAGTGKTYLAMAMAITAFKNNEVGRIILTRPAIEAGEKLGFLPGDLQSKIDPYLRPLYDALYQIMGAESFMKNSEKGLIEVAPLAYMRGRTLDNAFIILDEAQMLPVEFLHPILDVLQSLQASFKASILFTTATLPVFSGRIGTGPGAFDGLKTPVTEITSVHDNLFEAFKRVELHWPEPGTTTNFDELADELSGYDCVLCIVNTRKDARELYRRMPEGTLHLSRMMCSAHIMEVIKLIKQKLKDNEPVRVISTQLVEAGVDIDFPIVYRAFAGLDSIIQAAGRCNREGKLNHVGKLGQVFVFNLENTLLRGLMGKGAAALREILSVSDGSDLFSPECMAQYFSLFYSNCNTFDKANIKGLLYKGFAEMHFMFATAAEKFRLIDDKDSVSILVGYGDGATLLEELKRIGPEFWLLRKLQQYSVSIRKWDFEQLCKQGTVGVYAGIFILEDGRCYDERAGLVLDGAWVEELLLM